MLDDLDLTGITDAGALEEIARLLNVVEELSARLERATVENQLLRDENNRLKGEQARPRILPARPQHEHASDRERRETPTAWHKRPTLPGLPIDRVEECRLDRLTRPGAIGHCHTSTCRVSGRYTCIRLTTRQAEHTRTGMAVARRRVAFSSQRIVG